MHKPKSEKEPVKHHRIFVGSRHFSLPQSRFLRILVGYMLIFLGFFGFLPVLGFWMIPLGLWILSREYEWLRRIRRKLIVWWERRKQRKAHVSKAK